MISAFRAFARLPAKSLLRFRCVSKARLHLLSNPSVVERFRPTMSGFFYYPDQRIDDPKKHILKYESAYPDKRQQFDMEALSDIDMTLYDVCNGLLLYGNYAESKVMIVNPSTNTRLTLDLNFTGPPPFARFKRLKLAYFPLISPHFAIVMAHLQFNPTPKSFITIFDSSKLDYLEYQILDTEFPWGQQMFDLVGGWLYIDIYQNYAIRVGIIGAHQGKVERICMPPDLTPDFNYCKLFWESEGSCHYAMANRAELVIWVRNGSDWALKHSIDIWGFIEHHNTSNRKVCKIGARPLAFHPDLDVFFLDLDYKIYAFHAPSNTFEEMACGKICELDRNDNPIKPYTRCLVDPLQQMESFVKLLSKSPETRKIQIQAQNPDGTPQKWRNGFIYI